MEKPFYLSKTIVLNVIMGILATASAFIPALSSVRDFITDHASLIAVIWSALGIGLRLISKDKIVLGD